MSEGEKESLAHSIIVVTQGFIDGGVGNSRDYKRAFLSKLNLYKDVSTKGLKENLSYFLSEIIPVAEDYGITMCLHPDDPPFPVLGLPRIAGTSEDYKWIMDQHQSPANGITFCSGSLSSRAGNDLPAFLKTHGEKVHFAHLRNTTILDDDGSFCESGHVDGGADMEQIVKLLYKEMHHRKDLDLGNYQIPMRPDHGLKMAEDKNIDSNPGYPFFGRKKGLEEITDLEENLASNDFD